MCLQIIYLIYLLIESFASSRLVARRVRLPNQYPGYDTKQSDGEAPVMLGLWEMQSTPLLQSLPGTLWPRVVAPDRVLSMG